MHSYLDRFRRRFILRAMASFFRRVNRNPVTRTPDEVGLAFENITFDSLDGTKLKAWYIPANGRRRVVVFNHFMLGNRAGAIPHKDWGNVSVDFMPVYKHLVDAGYSVFTYDLRNHGESDVWEGGKLGLTNVEYQDSVASVRYAREQLAESKQYLFSQCYGGVCTIRGMKEHPKDFEDVSAFICLQPLTPEGFVSGVMNKMGLSNQENVAYFGEQLRKKTGYALSQLDVPAESVKIPTLLVQVRNDWRTTTKSIEEIYERLATKEKRMLWIEHEDERLQGYNFFTHHPEMMINWLARY